ncbi:hypothetical protein Tco_1051396 [Tanacetum coccineum]
MIAIQAEEGEGSGHPSEPQPPPQTSEPIPNVPDEAVYEEGSPKEQRSRRWIHCAKTKGPEMVPTPPCDSPLQRVYTLGSDEGSMTLLELMVCYTTLSKKGESLEVDLKQTKKVYGAAYTKLIKKRILPNRGADDRKIDQDARSFTLVTPTHSQEDQPEDQLGVFSAAKVLVDTTKENVHTYTRRRRAVSTGSGGISTASRLFSTAKESVSTAGASMPVSTAGIVQEVNISIPSLVVVKDKGKAAVRLQEELDEEERQRMARAHEAAQSFTEEE